MMDDIIKQLAEEGISGKTIPDGSGMAELIKYGGSPLFGMLRRILVDEEKVACKVMMFVLKDER